MPNRPTRRHRERHRRPDPSKENAPHPDQSERGEGDGNVAESVSFVERHAPDGTKPRRFSLRSDGLQLRCYTRNTSP